MTPSCSKIEEALESNEAQTENILIEVSPWVFSGYENTFVEDEDGSGLSSEEIENDMNQYLIGVSLTFEADGTGFIDIPEQGREDWVWTISEDRLTTVAGTHRRVHFF